MSIALVVTGGFGNGTFDGSITDVLRRGFGADGISGPLDPDTPTTRLLDTLLRSGSLKTVQARANLPDAAERTGLSSIDARDRTLTDV